MLDALGSAGTQAAGLWEFNVDGAMSKSLHPGKAAFNGILAADLAREGFTGATRILEGERGFFRATTSSYDASRITDGLGQEWKVTENCYKLHSCCGHTHTAIDVALDVRERRQWSAEDVLRDVTRIDVETYGPGYDIVCDPDPATPYRAKFSLAYCVAAALLEGAVGLEQFTPERFDSNGVVDARIAALLPRIRIGVRDDLTGRYPAQWPTRVAIMCGDGSCERGASDYPRGNPENPVSTQTLADKFLALVSPRYGDAFATRAMSLIRSIDDCADVRAAFATLG